MVCHSLKRSQYFLLALLAIAEKVIYLKSVPRGKGRMKEDRIQLNVRIPKQLKLLVSSKAALENRMIGDVIEELLLEYVEKTKLAEEIEFSKIQYGFTLRGRDVVNPITDSFNSYREVYGKPAIDILARLGRGMSPSEIAAFFGKDLKEIYKLIERFLEAGLLHRRDRGD
jgi:hypothetical protein